ncbi:hypothetical protein ACFCYN_18765 [Gottfriedia sp. NPDC056225]|uniref:hypothetical protein n=1 Tax=Gottfriedia sp. NPDC056225 TaxID=3345751 RepID=UPI0035DD2A95
MLQVVFTQLNHKMFQKSEKIDFIEAVQKSAELEKVCREEKKELDCHFYLIEKDSDGSPIYTGTFQFGSYKSPNLYQHIKQNLEQMKINKKHEQDKLILLSKMEDCLPDVFKLEEKNEHVHLIGLDQSRISKLKKWQRRTIYSIAGVVSLTLVGTATFMSLVISNGKHDVQKQTNLVKEQTKIINQYEHALLGDNESILNYFGKHKKDLTIEQTQLYAKLLLDQKKYKDVVGIYKNNVGFVETLISTKGSIDQLREYNASFPTDEGKFDLLFADKKYADLLKLTKVEMTVKRSEMKTYAYLKTGNIQGAKNELSNNNNEKLIQKITKYEDLTKQLKDIDKAISISKESKKNDDVKKLTDRKNGLQKQLRSI